MSVNFWRILPLAFLLTCLDLPAETIVGGLATGFPPYQYSVAGKPTGLDVDLAEAIAHEAGFEVSWIQRSWDEVVGILRTSSDLDFVTGMEQSDTRRESFVFGKTLYVRRNVLFVAASNSEIQGLADLPRKTVAGDRDAFGEDRLSGLGIKTSVRLVRTLSKHDAMILLSEHQVDAALMPEAVGWALSKTLGLSVRAVDIGDPGTPVSLAFQPRRRTLQVRLDAAFDRLKERGVVDKILRTWLK